MGNMITESSGPVGVSGALCIIVGRIPCELSALIMEFHLSLAGAKAYHSWREESNTISQGAMVEVEAYDSKQGLGFSQK